MTYEAIIKVDRDAPQIQRASEIARGIEYAALLLIDEYGWSFEAVEEALDLARDAAEYQWRDLHPDRS